jgi:ketol-acid reductoisomerase
MLADIRSGDFARQWIAENDNGRPWFNQVRGREREHLIEQVGTELRSMMPFVNPTTVSSDQTETYVQAERSQEQRIRAAV